MKILHMTLKRKWFDMIASGIKKEEYREIKPFWIKRLYESNHYDAILFKNGYRKDSPTLLVKFKGVHIHRAGVPEWGFEKRCFVIRLGEVIEKRNYELTSNNNN